MNRLILFLVSVLSAVSAVRAQSLDSLLRAVRASDQGVRIEYERVLQMQSPHPDSLMAAVARMHDTDSLNQRIVFSILDEQGWPEGLSDEANSALWLVIQHAADADQRRYLPLIRAQAEAGRVPWSDYATTLDRILMHARRPQRYGTQSCYKRTNDSVEMFFLWPVEDAVRLDSLRASVGLSPIAAYLKMLEEYLGRRIEWDPAKTVDDMP